MVLFGAVILLLAAILIGVIVAATWPWSQSNSEPRIQDRDDFGGRVAAMSREIASETTCLPCCSVWLNCWSSSRGHKLGHGPNDPRTLATFGGPSAIDHSIRSGSAAALFAIASSRFFEHPHALTSSIQPCPGLGRDRREPDPSAAWVFRDQRTSERCSPSLWGLLGTPYQFEGVP